MTKLLTQTEARRQAQELTEAGTPAIATATPPGSWGGTEEGWAVTLLNPERVTDQTPGCFLCSSRSTRVTIPADEWADHLEVHVQTPDSWTWPRLNWLLSQLPEPTVQAARTVTVKVADHERAWHPASTKNALYGPAVVTYVEYADGGFRATVES